MNPHTQAWLQFGVKLFYYQKFWEFIDTFIFMIRNNYRQVSFLHVYVDFLTVNSAWVSQ
jgi:elongation of very long chain fatty acids protein 4